MFENGLQTTYFCINQDFVSTQSGLLICKVIIIQKSEETGKFEGRHKGTKRNSVKCLLSFWHRKHQNQFFDTMKFS